MTEDYIVPLKPKKKFKAELRILSSVEMTMNEKKKLVEQGLKEFYINEKFRDLFAWILDEAERLHKEKMKDLLKELEEKKKTGKEIYLSLDSAFLLMQDATIGKLSKEKWVPLDEVKEKL